MNSHFHPQTNRLNYGEALEPPKGYELDFAVGMTYSLDLEAFLTVPVFLSCSEQVDEIAGNPYMMLESIRKNSDKIAIFCNGDGIKYVTPKNAAFFAMIEHCVHPVLMPEEKSYFHPKLWVVRYTKQDALDLLRVIVLSRNLTFDQSMDIAVVLEAEVTGHYRTNHQGLADLITFVSKSVSKTKEQEKVLSLADSVLQADDFSCGSDFISCRFVPFGIKGHYNEAEKIFSAYAYNTVVVSPFLSDSVVKTIVANTGRKTLVTRSTAVSKKVYDAFDEVWIPREEILNDEIIEEANQDGNFRDLHAKMIDRMTENGNYLYLGSLNATANAFYRNVEFMLELKYEGKFSATKDLLNEENNVFRKLEASYETMGEETEEMLSDFTDVVRAVKSARVMKEQNSYQIVIECSHSDENVEIAPFMKPNVFLPLEEETVWSDLKLHELSCLYIVKRNGQIRIIKIETEGIPEERNDVLFNQILRENDIYSYLIFLLSGGRAESLFGQEEMQRFLGKGNGNQAAHPPVPSLYEQLLRATAKSPHTIHTISDILEKVEPDMVDDSFKELVNLMKASLREEGET